MRILLYTGKGGVGKTTAAAATALRASRMGYRTIVLSTDAAHSLADSFDLPLGPDPTPIAENLWGQELDVYHQVESYWGTVQKYLEALLTWRGVEGIVAEELTVPPGMSEIASLLQLVHLHDSQQYDVIVLDCAPTGETLELLTLPEIARWWMEKIFPIHRRLVQVARPVMKPLVGMPLPGDDVYEAIEELFQQLGRMQKLLTDTSLTSVRLVVNAEKMVVKEAMRTHTYLSLYGYPVDLVVCNRIIPTSVSDSYFDTWKASQAKYIKMVEEGFAPTPIRYVPLMNQEVVGIDLLDELGEKLFGGDDPIAVYHVDRTYSFEKLEDGYLLLLPLPFTSKSDIDLKQIGDELIVQIGNQKRNLVLPRSLASLQTRNAKLEDGILRIRFAPSSNGNEQRR
jgi:arsenite-transporting ATPase